METTKKTRSYNIDFFKFICAFGVIITHTQLSTNNAAILGGMLSPFRVPFFIIISLVFFISGLDKTELQVLITKIWKRIVIPYLFWSLIYFSLTFFKHYLMHNSYSFQWIQIIFFGSSAVQLYFIPKILIAQGFALGVFMLLKANYKSKLIGLTIFLVSIVWLNAGIYNQCLGFNKNDYLIISLYLILAYSISKVKVKNIFKAYYAIFGLALFTLVLLFKLGFYNHIFFNNYNNVLGGLSFTFLAFSIHNIFFSKKTETILGYSYGIYLSHVLFIEAFEAILNLAHINLFYDFWVKLIFSFCVLLSSICFVFYLKQKPILRKFLLGE